ncbi:MAG: phosphopantetheine adenylyltransferase [Candidatus Bathyarchaeia archaeon]|jgi:pantetheine-phosphate adenylyltransferase
MKQFKKVAVGGTFDRLHKGHHALLDKAFEVGEKVVIGLTSDSFVDKMGKPHKTASYESRQKDLWAFLCEKGLAERAEIVPLNDAYGLTVSGRGLDALVVSEETEKTGEAINKTRRDAHHKPLEIIVVNLVPAENHCPISTTRIRRGEIDRNGHLIAAR